MPPCCSPELFVAWRSDVTASSDTPGAAGVTTAPAVTISTAPGTPPTAVTGHHLPALNGLRALAVLAVMAYHLQLGWASGGYLGVDLFFVLSGFLITTLLLEEWVRTGALRLGRFWGRRARRLLPALFVLVAALAAYLILNAFLGPGANGLVDLEALRGDAVATLLYVANWHAIYAHQSYFAQFSAPSPLQHTWSLAIEEQFYLVWPPVLLLLLVVARAAWRRAGLVLTVAGTLASAGLMALLFHRGFDPTRVYFGTDTRSFDLMAGATVAFLVAARPQPAPAARRAFHIAAPAAAAVLGVLWVTAGTPEGVPRNWMFQGGFLLAAALAAVVIADARLLDRGPFARALSVPPLHFLGTISYGVYLWHWPIFVYLTAARTGLSAGPLDAVRLTAALLIATASYYLVELPIRSGRLRRPMRVWLAPAAGLAAAAAVVVATIPAIADPTPVAGTSAVVTAVHRTAAAAATGGTAHTAGPAGTAGTGRTGRSDGTGRAAAAASAGPAGLTGTGGYHGQLPIRLPARAVISHRHRLRVMLIGDSVMHDASFGIVAALSATGEVEVATNTIDGFGLVNATNWRTSIPLLIRTERPQLIIGTWSWDEFGPTSPNALHEPEQYTALLRSAMRTMLRPGDGVAGVILLQFPPSGEIPSTNPAAQRAYDAERARGNAAWNAIAARMPSLFPGRVMYLPVAGSILLHGRFSSWLPPPGVPHAPEGRVGARPQARQRPPLPRRQRPLRRGSPGRPHDDLPTGAGLGRLVTRRLGVEPGLQHSARGLSRRSPSGLTHSGAGREEEVGGEAEEGGLGFDGAGGGEDRERARGGCRTWPPAAGASRPGPPGRRARPRRTRRLPPRPTARRAGGRRPS